MSDEQMQATDQELEVDMATDQGDDDTEVNEQGAWCILYIQLQYAWA